MTYRLWLMVGGLAMVAVLGLVAGELGSASIRSASRTHAVGSLAVSSAVLVPGVPVQLHLASSIAPPETVRLILRWPTGAVAAPAVSDERQADIFWAVVPCGGPVSRYQPVRLLLRDAASGVLLGQSRPLTILPPGPDCVFGNR